MKQLQKAAVKGRINHSVCQWCYRGIPIPDLCAAAAQMGLKGIDLLTPEQWGPLKEHDLICTMTSGSGSIEKGLNRPENHEEILTKLRRNIDLSADAGFPNVITFSGNRHAGPNWISDDEGMNNCVVALKQIVGHAEQKKVTICMELLNSKVNHKDYMFDKTAWGVDLCKAVGSERFKILYDIYHAQIMEGDIISTMTGNIEFIAHVHTGGVPGRHEIDHTQELNYPTIMRALAETSFKGYVAQEFIPTGDPLTSLANAVRMCDV